MRKLCLHLLSNVPEGGDKECNCTEWHIFAKIAGRTRAVLQADVYSWITKQDLGTGTSWYQIRRQRQSSKSRLRSQQSGKSPEARWEAIWVIYNEAESVGQVSSIQEQTEDHSATCLCSDSIYISQWSAIPVLSTYSNVCLLTNAEVWATLWACTYAHTGFHLLTTIWPSLHKYFANKNFEEKAVHVF